MRPALYYPWVYLKGGAERVLLELLRRSRHEWTLYTNHFDPHATYPELAEMNVVQLGRVSVRRDLIHTGSAGLRLLTQRLDLRNHDSLMVVSEGFGNLVAARSGLPTSCICLTPLKVLYDPVTRDLFYRGRHRPHYRAALALYQAIDKPAWRRYERIFCNSQEVRQRVLDARLADPARVDVTYHGVDTDQFSPDGRREGFYLVPGRIMWQKNIELAIAAWQELHPEPQADASRLIVAGMVDRKSRPYLDQMRANAGGRPDIEFVTSPTDAQLLDLYQRCRAVLFPPGNEDWGLVPLEAMACAKPVLAIDHGGPRESVIDGETGFLAAPSVEAFSAGIRRLDALSHARLDEMGRRARARAMAFPWSAFVDRIDDHVEELAARRGTAGGFAVESTRVSSAVEVPHA